MSFVGIHHLRYAVDEPEKFAKFFINQFGFEYFAHRHEPATRHPTIVLKHQGVIFIINKRLQDASLTLNENNNQANSFLSGNVVYPVDTVCDVCFQCSNVNDIVKKANALNKDLVLVRSQVKDENGTVDYAILKSPVGNVQHTLIDLSCYDGKFLPGFDLEEKSTTLKNHLLFCIDHVAMVLPQGYANEAISWYNFCFGFERLIINTEDSIENGFIVQQDNRGMRLRAVHGLNLCSNDCKGNTVDNTIIPAKLVFGESMSEPGKKDQITMFLGQHRGMGVQHVGLGTTNIIKAIKHFEECGAKFMTPPEEYYTDEEKCREIEELKMSLEDLRISGVMVESGSGDESQDVKETEICMPSTQHEPWYIMQVFTKNIFKEKTFFMELIQRHRTEGGFGAGNIKALWTIQKSQAAEHC